MVSEFSLWQAAVRATSRLLNKNKHARLNKGDLNVEL